MFGKDTTNAGAYTNVNSAGTEFLRNTIRAKIYSGDPNIEQKLTQMQLHWKFYNNQHWAKNNDELLSFNYVRAIIDKVNNFIIGKEGFSNNVVDSYGEEVDPDLEKSLEALINYNWEKNCKKVFLQKLLQMGSVSGDAYVFLYPNRQKGYVEYTILDSRITVPKFKKGDYSEIESYKVIKVLGTNEQKYTNKVTEYTKDSIDTYYIKSTAQDADKYEFTSVPNEYDFIPIVHISNIPMADNYGGKSDMDDILKINKVYNEMAEDVKMVIDYYSQPTTVITGGTVGQLKRGINQIWSGLPAEAQVFNLSLGEDLTASNHFLTLLKNAMHDLSGVPEEVLSKVQHISNTSASALQMLYQPIIQVADKKSVSYGEGIAELNRMTCLMFKDSIGDHPLYENLYNNHISKMENGKMNIEKFFDRYYIAIVWQYNLPNDRMGMLNEASLELNVGIGSRREIMERLGKRNIPKLLEEIKQDREENSQAGINPTSFGMTAPPSPPNNYPQ